MRRLTILELEYHVGFLATLVRLFRVSGWKVAVFTNTRNARELSVILEDIIDDTSVEICSGELTDLLNAASLSTKKSSLFINFSLQAHPFLAPSRVRMRVFCPSILYTPRLSNWFSGRYHWPISKQALLDNWFRWFRMRMKSRYDAYLTHSPETAKVIQKKWVHDHKPVFSLPYVFVGPNDIRPKNPLPIIVIPGSIEAKRRDYKFVLNALTSLRPFRRQFLLIISGVPNGSGQSNRGTTTYADDIINGFDQLKKDNYQIVTFDQRLDESDYENNMRKADAIWAPVNVQNYGIEQWTAGVAESIRFRKPLIIPSEYQAPYGLCSVALRYNNLTELEAIILDIINRRNQPQFLDQFLDNKFRPESVSEKFLNELRDTILG